MLNNITKCELMEKNLYTNAQTEKIKYYYEEIIKDYPTAIIAGGSIVDCLYEKDFYDVDVFVHCKDINISPTKKPHNGLVNVIKHSINGELIDIVVVYAPVLEQIENFDMGLKKCYYNGNFVFTEDSKNDIRNNTLTLEFPTSDSNYFRYKRTIEKYNLDISTDFLILENYINYLSERGKKIRTSKKYAPDVEQHTPTAAANKKLAKKTKIIMRQNRAKENSKSIGALKKFVE